MSYINKKPSKKQQFAMVALGTVVVGVVGYVLYQSFYKEQKKSGGCCSKQPEAPRENAANIKTFVKDAYSGVVNEYTSEKKESADSLAKAFGYTEEELAAFGEDANMGLSCGNPIAHAHLKFGESVLDLGCGGGFDVMLAAAKVGAGGTVWGIDMSQDMINQARANALKRGIANVQFHVAEIEKMPIADNKIDCVISNCVLNLVPDKLAAFREIYRVMKPGGRLSVADVALRKPFPSMVNDDTMAFMSSYVNCLSGAVLVEEYERLLREAGFQRVQFIDKHSDLNLWKDMYEERMDAASDEPASSCCGPPKEKEQSCCSADVMLDQNLLNFSDEQKAAMKAKLNNLDYNEFCGSYYVLAQK